MVGDAVDLIPFITGIGEAVKVVNASSKADNVLDAAKAIKNKVNKSVGVYEITYSSGKNYVGKGPFARAIQSASKNRDDDIVTSIRWKASYDDRTAYIEEYALQTRNKVKNKATYNLIWSPGKNYYFNSRRDNPLWKRYIT